MSINDIKTTLENCSWAKNHKQTGKHSLIAWVIITGLLLSLPSCQPTIPAPFPIDELALIRGNR